MAGIIEKMKNMRCRLHLSRARPDEDAESASGGEGGAGGEGGPGARAPIRWLRRKLSSTTTSVYILAFMTLFYILGTVFPQGANIEDYVNAGGGYVRAVEVFNLLDVFSSPIFILSSIALFANLVVCTYDRYMALFGRRAFPKRFEPQKTIYLTQNPSEAHEEVKSVLRERLGFRAVSKDSDWIVMEKGLPWRLLTVFYHAGLIPCFLGFFLTFFFAYEGEIKLYPGKAETIKPEVAGRLQGLLSYRPRETAWSLLLDEFRSEYYQTAKLDYPGDRASRLAVGLGWRAPAYQFKDDSLYPKEWTSSLRVIKDLKTVHAKTIEVNDPLKYGGYTLYQMGYEHQLRIKIDGSPILLETKAGEDLFIPGLSNPVRFSEMKTGTMQRIDGGVERIVPFTRVSVASGGGGEGPGAIDRGESKGSREHEEMGALRVGSTMDIEGRKVSVSGFDEASVLSYRYDPGAGILWFSGIFVLITLSLRCYWAFYTLAYNIDESGGITFVDLNVTARGVFADRDKLIKRLEYFLTRNDIKPQALPPP